MDQGPVRGNRYGVARGARPPGARLVGLFALGRMREVIEAGMEAGREKWPQGLWFHTHGFGTTNRAAWGTLWRTLSADGIKLEPPPRGLLATRLHNATVRRICAVRDYFDECQADLLNRFEEGHDVAISGAIT